MTVLLTSALAAALLMTLAWAVVRVTGSGGWTDVFWAFAAGLIGMAAALAPVHGAPNARQIIVAVMVALWSARLGLYLLARTWRSEHVDPRYAALTRRWGGWGLKAWSFLMVQAATVLGLVVSVWAAAMTPGASPDWRDGAGVLLMAAAIGGEALADQQMAAFRRDPANRGRVADTGLWAWSRHPNYFFEWLAWLAYPLIALRPVDYPLGWLSLLAPIQMWILLNYISGVPMLEFQMLKSRPEAYRAYQARVSRFLPLPPRSPTQRKSA